MMRSLYSSNNFHLISPKSTISLYYLTTITFFFDVPPFMLLIAGPVAIGQLVLQEYNALQLDVDLSLAGPACL
jgi:hypothetical protein